MVPGLLTVPKERGDRTGTVYFKTKTTLKADTALQRHASLSPQALGTKKVVMAFAVQDGKCCTSYRIEVDIAAQTMLVTHYLHVPLSIHDLCLYLSFYDHALTFLEVSRLAELVASV